MTDPSGLQAPAELIEDVRREIERLKSVSQELEALPWYGFLVTALRGVKKARVHTFLRAIESAEENLDDQQRQQLRDAAHSEEGAALLTDYAESVVRTSSGIAIAAFGLLYAHPSDEEYPRAFRRLACEALEGISDELVTLFLALLDAADHMLSQPRASTGRTHQVPGGTVDVFDPFIIVLPKEDYLVERTGVDAARVYMGHQHLTGRGLLLADPSTGRWGGDPSLAFGIGEDTRRFQRLLARARDSMMATTQSNQG